MDSKIWEVAKLVIPVVATVVLGFFVSSSQNKIQQQVEVNNRLLSTRQALREEFYKQRLKVYGDTCKQLTSLRESLDLLEQKDPNINQQAADNINAVDRLRKSEFLYMSDELVAELRDLWALAVDRTRAADDDGATIMEKISKQVLALEARMKADLQTSVMAQAY